MRRCLVSLVLFCAVLPSLSQDYLPRDVQRFVDRREGCDKLRGDRGGINEVGRELRKLCGSMDKELVQLKKKYAANSTIMQILNQFDVGIEGTESNDVKKKNSSPNRMT